MTRPHKTLTILGLAALAAGLIGTAQPATAAGLTHPAAFTRTAAIADHDNWNSRDRDFRRDQILRRQEEFRREEAIWREQARRHNDRRDFQGDRRDFQGDRRDDRGFRDNR